MTGPINPNIPKGTNVGDSKQPCRIDLKKMDKSEFFPNFLIRYAEATRSI